MNDGKNKKRKTEGGSSSSVQIEKQLRSRTVKNNTSQTVNELIAEAKKMDAKIMALAPQDKLKAVITDVLTEEADRADVYLATTESQLAGLRAQILEFEAAKSSIQKRNLR